MTTRERGSGEEPPEIWKPGRQWERLGWLGRWVAQAARLDPEKGEREIRGWRRGRRGFHKWGGHGKYGDFPFFIKKS
jgi:hypothetical protein